jgi:hypothetical protein
MEQCRFLNLFELFGLYFVDYHASHFFCSKTLNSDVHYSVYIFEMLAKYVIDHRIQTLKL